VYIYIYTHTNIQVYTYFVTFPHRPNITAVSCSPHKGSPEYILRDSIARRPFPGSATLRRRPQHEHGAPPPLRWLAPPGHHLAASPTPIDLPPALYLADSPGHPLRPCPFSRCGCLLPGPSAKEPTTGGSGAPSGDRRPLPRPRHSAASSKVSREDAEHRRA
jgi:hypothetical protein